MKQTYTSIAVVIIVLTSLLGATATPVAAQEITVDTKASNGTPTETVVNKTVSLPVGATVDVTAKADNASVANVSIDVNTTANIVNVTVDVNGDGIVDATGEAQVKTETGGLSAAQLGTTARVEVQTNSSLDVSLHLVLRLRGG